jgi:hypothetical protein
MTIKALERILSVLRKAIEFLSFFDPILFSLAALGSIISIYLIFIVPLIFTKIILGVIGLFMLFMSRKCFNDAVDNLVNKKVELILKNLNIDFNDGK